MKNFFLLLGLATLAMATHLHQPAPFVIEGMVFDQATNDPLIGASVLVKGSAQGAITDVDGKFRIASTDSCATLVVSYVGYTTHEMQGACAGARGLRIGLASAGMELEEVAVTGKARSHSRRARMDAGAGVPQSAPAPPPGYAISGLTARTSPSEPDYQGEGYAAIRENGFRAAGREPLSTFSIDVDAAAYSNLRRFLNRNQLPPRDAVRVEEMINYFNYTYPEPAAGSDHPLAVSTELSDCPWQPQHKLLLVGMRGRRIPTDNVPASNLVFLLDVSGSMNDPLKLPLLRESLKMLVNNLRPTDKVSIVVYAGASGLALPATSGADKQRIIDALDQLQAGGSTAGAAGIQQAYQVARANFVEGGNNRIILATDGDFNVGVSSESELLQLIEQERQGGIFLTVLGFGTGNYQDQKMQLLADHGNGHHAYIDNLAEAQKVLVTEFGGTLFTIAKDVKLQVEFNPALVQGYRLVGYENRLLANEDFNNDAKDAGELGAGHTVTALYEIIPVGVSTDLLGSVDSLKYQPQTGEVRPEVARPQAELCTVKLRYKPLDSDESVRLDYPVAHRAQHAGQTSLNFRWAAAVAEFGMLLRSSDYLGQATYESCRQLAIAAKGLDPFGYRQEMIDLIGKAQTLAAPTTAERN